MSDFVPPFSNVYNLVSEFNSEQIIPYHVFSKFNALQSRLGNNTYNVADEIDAEIGSTFSYHCNYFDSDSFRNVTFDNSFSLFVHNINSIPKNLDSFASEVLSGDSKPMIIGFCETKLTSYIESIYQLNGYQSVYHSNNTRSGGLAFFVRSDVKFSVKTELTCSESFLECICIEVEVGSKKTTVCLMYRRPGSNFDQFMVKYEEIISTLNGRCLYLCGDLNLDLLRYENSSVIQSFVNLNFEHSLINKPTRVTSHSATVIDHIWCNFVSESPPLCGVLLSDHCNYH